MVLRAHRSNPPSSALRTAALTTAALILLLGESLAPRLVIAASLILGGVGIAGAAALTGHE